MDDRTNTTFGWILFSGIVLLGGISLSSHYFDADSPHAPEEGGYFIEGVAEEGEEDDGPALATLLASADLAAGEQVFAKCSACHTVTPGGATGIGPNVHAIMGAPIAAGSFAYSSDLSAVGGNWTWEQMDAWLASPRKFAAGTKMSFAGLGKPEDRANLMAWLNTQGSNIPLPPPPPPEEEGDAPAQDNGEMGEQVGTDFDDATAVNQPDPELQDTPVLSDEIPAE
jgi:cytochrome c